MSRNKQGNFINYQSFFSDDGNYISSEGGGTKVVLRVPPAEGSQSITAGVWTTITGWEVSEGDAGMLSGDGIKVSETGKYMIGGACGLETYSTIERNGIRILKDGSTIVAYGEEPLIITAGVGSSPAVPTRTGTMMELTAGVTLELQVWHNDNNFDTPPPENYGHPFFFAIKVN